MRIEESDEQIIIQPQGEVRTLLIWLHGLGADGHDFVPVVEQMGLLERFAMRVILPNAPQQAVTINGGMRMPSWYDIHVPDLTQKADFTGIQHSVERISRLIDTYKPETPASIILAGFSQGGVVALHTALQREDVSGVIALSTYLLKFH
ncbi:MAG: hypothetical protein KZQ58_02945 [gamma proteobacterium symbiont of Bathyaustriella thionipta]|nr:hypothetical protein [gamma proteobacterium symbiont of Bathyaustriella thionipta]